MPTIYANQSTILKKDDEFRLRANFPPYRVAEITEGPSPTLVLQLNKEAPISHKYKDFTLPEEVRVPSDGTFLIGRLPEAALRIVEPPPAPGEKALTSRSHATIDYVEGVGFRYTHFARHPGEITGEIYQGKEAVAQTIQVTRQQAEELAAAENAKPQIDYELKAGSRIKFHHTMPYYQVTQLDLHPKKMVLEQEQENGNTNYPARIEVGGDIPVTIARSNEMGMYAFPHPAISGNTPHGIFGWSEEKMAFLYSSISENLPTVGPAIGLLAEQQEICGRMEFKGEQQAREELGQIKRLIERIGKYQKNLNKVQDFEGSLADVRRDDREGLSGGHTEESQIGYALWLESLAAIYKDALPEQDIKKVNHMAGVVKELAKDRANLRDIEDFEIPPYEKATRDAPPYTVPLREYVSSKAQELREFGETYLIAGYKGHHVVAKLSREADGYHITTYNAGMEAKPAPQGRDNPDGSKVKGIYENKVKRSTDPEELIRLLAEKKIRPMLDPSYLNLVGQIEGRDAPEPNKSQGGLMSYLGKLKFWGSAEPDRGGMVGEEIRYVAVKPQTIGNCTTRSTRHALEDALGGPLMQRIGRNVADPDVSTAEDLKEALKMRMGHLVVLGRRHGVELDYEGVNVAQSIDFKHLLRRERDDKSSDSYQTPAQSLGEAEQQVARRSTRSRES